MNDARGGPGPEFGGGCGVSNSLPPLLFIEQALDGIKGILRGMGPTEKERRRYALLNAAAVMFKVTDFGDGSDIIGPIETAETLLAEIERRES